MKIHAIHIVVATLLMILCALAAAFLPPMWQGVSGRDFRPQLAMMGFLIFLLALVLRTWRRWPVVEFLGATVCAELFALCVIGHFSGLTWLSLFDGFNLSWLAEISVFIAVPWILGLVVGSVLLTAVIRVNVAKATAAEQTPARPVLGDTAKKSTEKHV